MKKIQKNEWYFLSVKELAAQLGISPNTIYNQLSAGTFPVKCKRLGRMVKFDSRDVQSFVDSLKEVHSI